MVEQLNSGSDSSITIKINTALDFLEKTVLLIGRCNNTVTYERRINVLLVVTGTSSSQVASMLKEKAAFLENTRSRTLWAKYQRPPNQKSESKKEIY